jgi:hypothetical protein
MSVLCVWLILVRAAGWFDPFRETRQSAPLRSRRTIAARWAATFLFTAGAIFPLWLLYRLMAPTPIPDLRLPRPNTHDDLIAAGRVLADIGQPHPQSLAQLPISELEKIASQSAPAMAKVREAIRGDCRFPLMRFSNGEPILPQEEVSALHALVRAIFAARVLSTKTQLINDRLAVELDLLWLSLCEKRGSGTRDGGGIFASHEYLALNELWDLRAQLNTQQRKEMAKELWSIDAQRVPWPLRIERQRIIDRSADWRSHLQSLLDELSGKWPAGDRWADLYQRVEIRMLMIEFAARAFQEEKGQLPSTLAELVPDFLPAVPEDPFHEGQPLKYRASGEEFTVYSIGPDQKDDGGKSPAKQGQMTGDVLAADIFWNASATPAANTAGAPED